MKRFASTICLAACLALLCGSPAWAFVNSVVVESKDVAPGATGVSLGIYVENASTIHAIVMVLDVKTLYGGAFWSATSAQPITVNAAGRLIGTPFDPGYGDPPIFIRNKYPVPGGVSCSGPDPNKHTYAVSGALDHVSPDGLSLNLVTTDPGDIGMVAGTDGVPPPGAGIPSIKLGTFTANGVNGSAFVVDTGCVTPANHLSFVELAGALIAPSFTPGIVRCTIPPNPCPTPLTGVPDPVNATVGVLASAQFGGTDPDPLRFCMRSGPGSVDLLTGRWTYTPTCADVPGFDVCVEVFDDQHSCGNCSAKCVHVNVAAVTLALACSDVSVDWNAANAAQTVVASFGCPPYTYAVVLGKGGFADPTLPAWTYDQGCADVGSSSVTVEVTDDVGAKARCTFNLTVTACLPPCPDPVFVTVGEGESHCFFLGALVDCAGNPVSYSILEGPLPLTGWAGESLVGNLYCTGTRPAGDPREFTFHQVMTNGCLTQPCDPGFGIRFKTPCVAIYGECGSWCYYSTTLSGRNKTVYIVAEPGSVPGDAGGFDFLICYDQSGLTFLNAKMGPDVAGLGLGLGWEYFTYRTGMFGGNCGGGCPDGYVKIVGIADMNNGIPQDPADFNINGKVLACLTFFVTSDRNFINSCLHIGFCSYDCGDNIISDKTGNIVWTPAGGVIFGPDYECPDDPKVDYLPLITYCPGAICVVPPPDDRGDINLNGIANEIGDAVLFTNYFIYGPTVWDDTYEDIQILSTDINNDGIVLTVADLIYLIRIITGDAQPFPGDTGPGSPKLSPYANSVDVLSDVSNSTLNVRTSTSVELGAALLVYRYDGMAVGTPVLSSGTNLRIKSRASNGELRILVWGESKGAKVPAGANNLVSVPVVGNGTIELVESQFSDYDGGLLTVNAAGVARPTSYALLQNYPNPFNAGTVIPIQLSSESDWTLTVYNVAGQVVRSYMGHDGAGTRNVAWDGMDQSGAAVASGMYFYRATAKDFTAVKKMVLMK